MAIVAKIATCLWFDKEAEDAANFYVSIFRNSGIDTITRYGKEGFEKHRQPEGSVQTVTFRLDGHTFTALNGGPRYTHSPAVSFVVHCESQDEVDYFWGRLGAGGDPTWQVCGWLRDKFGVSMASVLIATSPRPRRWATTRAPRPRLLWALALTMQTDSPSNWNSNSVCGSRRARLRISAGMVTCPFDVMRIVLIGSSARQLALTCPARSGW
jgi:predicted 3-demethylubiquinone-9 3-methyltransferase (glyoxalase superfamily)